MQGDAAVEVVLRFSPAAAFWVSEQIWHPEQEATREVDGRLLLRFAVADYRELVKRILSHGAGVQVVAPPELRQLVREEINPMATRYAVDGGE